MQRPIASRTSQRPPSDGHRCEVPAKCGAGGVAMAASTGHYPNRVQRVLSSVLSFKFVSGTDDLSLSQAFQVEFLSQTQKSQRPHKPTLSRVMSREGGIAQGNWSQTSEVRTQERFAEFGRNQRLARSPKNMMENFAVKDFSLTSQEMDRISFLDRGPNARVGFDPNLIA